jgi:hypothetical protein
MKLRPTATLALAGAALALGGCETARDLNPLSATPPEERHCRAAIIALATPDGGRPRIEDASQGTREENQQLLRAVTIVYVQGEARRLATCLYASGDPRRAVAISYRGERLTAERLAAANAAAQR